VGPTIGSVDQSKRR